MDIDRFDTREKAHQGVDIPFEHGGEVIYGDDDKPVTFRMRGVDDPEVRRLIMVGRRAGAKRTPEEADEEDFKLARAACLGWSDNWTHKGEKIPFDRKNIPRVFGIPAFRKFYLSKLLDDEAFMNGPSDGPSSTSDN